MVDVSRVHPGEWMSGIRPASAVSVDISALSQDGLAVFDRLGVDGLAWCLETAQTATSTIFASMPMLADDAALLRIFTRGVRASVLREMRMAAGDDLDPVNDEGADVARDFVQRGLDLTTLLESIRIGGSVSASCFIKAANEVIDDPTARANETQRLSRLFFDVLEQFSTEMTEAYELERARWLASRSGERLRLVNAILGGRPVDRRALAGTLQYDLDARHVAVVAWAEDSSVVGEDPLVNDAITNELRAHGAKSMLVVPVGIGAAWGWGAVAETPPPTSPVIPEPGICTATSQRHVGEAGFRRAHREARDVERLLLLAVPSTQRSLRHADVELATILSADLENAQHFVRRQLGRLAVDDERMDHLRNTLWLYLENERSVAAVASLQFVARNTVTYRVKQAEQLIGQQIDDARLNVQTALLLTRLLGERVLVGP